LRFRLLGDIARLGNSLRSVFVCSSDSGGQIRRKGVINFFVNGRRKKHICDSQDLNFRRSRQTCPSQIIQGRPGTI
jgi:hypothetical protein